MRVRRIEGYNFFIEKVALQISKIQTVHDTLAYTKTFLDQRFFGKAAHSSEEKRNAKKVIETELNEKRD